MEEKEDIEQLLNSEGNGDEADNEGEGVAKKKKSKFFNFKNPITTIKKSMAQKKVNEQRRLFKREEVMKQDRERFLMELEEKHSWLSSELNDRNYQRLKRETVVASILSKQEMIDFAKEEKVMKETGLSFQKGIIQSYERWQNSPAKHLDIAGHNGPVNACKLSSCLRYILSCSSDTLVKIWSLKTGKCLRSFVGHTANVFDCDIHASFDISATAVVVVSCCADGSIFLWNCILKVGPVRAIKDHREAVYRCSFSPDGNRVVSCGEDQTVRIFSVPEGFQLFCYTGHKAPVTSVRFSPSGRVLLSASDFGERKLIIWDAAMPKIDDTPIQLPHMIFWSPNGLIRKILLRKATPHTAFWLSLAQSAELNDDDRAVPWTGEYVTDVIRSVVVCTSDTSRCCEYNVV